MNKTICIEYKDENGKRTIREIHPIFLKTSEGEYKLEAVENEFLLQNILRFFSKGEEQVFFCATAYIVDKNLKFFLMKHKKLGKFVPPGGKIENNELPHMAAIRETKEETGLDVEIIEPNYGIPLHNQPFGVQENHMPDGMRCHMDFIYLARALSKDIVIDNSEAVEYGWFDIDEIQKLDTFDDVKKWTKYFDELLRK